MLPDGLALPGCQGPPFAYFVLDHFVEYKTVDRLVSGPVVVGAETQTAFEHADHDFSLLPELFFHIMDTAGVGPFDVDAAELEVDAVVPAVVHRFFDDDLVLLPSSAHDIGGVGEQPCEFDVVASGGIVVGVGLGAALGESVPAPDDIEFHLRGDLPAWGELRDSGSVLRMQDAFEHQVDVLDERAFVDGLAGGFVERGKSLHQVHVGIEGLSISAAGTWSAEVPVAFKHLEIAAVHRVGRVLFDQVEDLLCVFEASLIAGGQGVFAQRVHAEAQAVEDFFVDGDVAGAVDRPEEAAVDVVPHLVDHEIDSVSGVFSAFAVAVAGAVGRGHRKDGATLGNQGFFILAAIVAVGIEMRDETAVDIVFAAVQPERQQFPGQMLLTLIQSRINQRQIHSHIKSPASITTARRHNNRRSNNITADCSRSDMARQAALTAGRFRRKRKPRALKVRG